MPDFKKQGPDKIIERVLILQYIRQHHMPDELEEVIPGTNMVELLYNEDGIEENFFNWEFMLFDVPLPELAHMGMLLEGKNLKKLTEEEKQNQIRELQLKDEIAKKKIQGDAWKGSDALSAMIDDYEKKQLLSESEEVLPDSDHGLIVKEGGNTETTISQNQVQPEAPVSSSSVGKIVDMKGNPI